MCNSFNAGSRSVRWLSAVSLGALLVACAAGAAVPKITEYGRGITPDSWPLAIAAGPHGNLWFTENEGFRIGKITPAGVVTEYRIRTFEPAPDAIAAGPDGNLWFTEYVGNKIGKITPTGVITEYGRGITPDCGLVGITAGPDGNLWFTEELSNRIGEITPAGVVTEYRNGITAYSHPEGITAGPDGNLWFTEAAGRIGKITPAGVISEYSAGITGGIGVDGLGITAGPDGNLWFTESNRIGKITPGGVITEYGAGITRYNAPEGIAAGPDGNLWFTEINGIGKITPAGVITQYSAGITPDSLPQGIAAGPDGNLWFTESAGNRIGRLALHAIAPPRVTVTVIVKGKGRIIGGRINCPARCAATIASGTKLTLRARAARGFQFAGWRGPCRGLPACVLHPRTAVKVIATFRRHHR